MKWLRKLAVAVLRDRVFVRRLPAEFGTRPIHVSASSALRYLKWSWHESHEDLFRLARELVEPGHQVWDIGANAGVLGLAAAHRCGPEGGCLFVEPDPVMVDLLERTVEHPANQDRRLGVLGKAVSDRDGTSTLLISAGGRSANALREAGQRRRPAGFRAEHTVATARLDDLLADHPPPDLVKIDVEGAELLALRGAGRLLRDVRPILYIEVGGRQREEMTIILKQHDYQLFRGREVGYPPRDYCTHDTLAIPRENVKARESKQP